MKFPYLSYTGCFYLLFFFSGFPALFYQLVWQRALFALYGLDSESIALIVAAFMFGLGMGSLLGGWLSKKMPRYGLVFFGLIECSIGFFGYYSLPLFHWIANATIHIAYWNMFFIAFVSLCIPTVLMGATLPLLVTKIMPRIANVGHSVSNLYFFNTLGSSFACFAAIFGLMFLLGQAGMTHLAAAINGLIGLTAFVFAYRDAKKNIVTQPEKKTTPVKTKFFNRTLMGMCFLSSISGFIALSYEVIWMRAYGLLFAGKAALFAEVLGFYLLGIAYGAFFSRSYCQSKDNILFILSFTIILTSVLGFLLLPFVAYLSYYTTYFLALPFLCILSSLLGFTFPLLCHRTLMPDDRVGNGLGYIYFSNIVGATLGSLLTGLILFDHWNLQQNTLFLSLLELFLGLVLLCLGIRKLKVWVTGISASVFLGVVMMLTAPSLFAHVYEKLQHQALLSTALPLKKVIENKSGVIAVGADKSVYGGGVYDGHFNTNLFNKSNGIIRAYAIGAFVAHPSNVLMIGLSSASWAQIIANHPDIQHLTIIEINPGYLSLIQHYPEVRSILKNPKVTIVIDDGRRWLRRHSEKKFDLIVMNTTFHWREHASNLLSTDFLQLIRHSLKPGGVAYYNTTGSPEVLHTAAAIYPYALRVINFVAVSDSPLLLDKNRWKKILTAYTLDGHPVFHLDRTVDRAKLKEMLGFLDTAKQGSHAQIAMEFKSSFLPRVQSARIITDDNMGTEW